MTLDMVKGGDTVTILDISDAEVKAQAIRFGIFEGQTVTCTQVVPAGPIIIRKNTQELALGRGLARQVKVDLGEDCKSCRKRQKCGRRGQRQ
jgi:ferrous iron transport protein A